MIDGRHTGTGGGNHVVVGGATPNDSPFLRRPDLLKSLILHWQRHPSLSTCSPACSSARPARRRASTRRGMTALRAGIALAQMAIRRLGQGRTAPPWLVDRLLRNLLVDVTGNTHRAEICIDKLYSPDGPTGRLGLVEFRGFEMPPTPRMSLAQQLLIRALIARFWKAPQGPLHRWGTALHDRFMLPHFVWQDFLDVLDDLRRNGFDLRPGMVRAQARVPLPVLRRGRGMRASSWNCGQALEPWHVLGETGAIGGTVRYTSTARWNAAGEAPPADPRAATPSPATAAGAAARDRTSGESVAGVRFKAWQPAAALHPTLPVNAPLTFDIYDTWTAARSAAASITSRIPAGATTTPSRSTATRRRRGGWRVSCRPVTPRPVRPRAEAPTGISDDARPASAGGPLAGGQAHQPQPVEAAQPCRRLPAAAGRAGRNGRFGGRDPARLGGISSTIFRGSIRRN
jgi:uncharacterized protein (DUF2126 family)